MKRALSALLALFACATFGATLNPVQLLNPAGSTAGQAIVSTGASTAPGWATVVAGSLSPVAANTVIANPTGSTAAPAAFAMPSCSAGGNALNWTSGTGFTCATGYAALASPTFTGTPAAPTAAAGTSTTQLATTAFLTQPGPIGSATANTGRFTTLQATGAITPSSTAGLVGTATNDNANAGSIGEYVTATGTGVSLTTSTFTNITSVSLTAGDWDVAGNIVYTPAATTTIQVVGASINTTSATFNANPFYTQNNYGAGTANQVQSTVAPTIRLSLSSTTTVYMVGYCQFATSTLSATGFIRARRVR